MRMKRPLRNTAAFGFFFAISVYTDEIALKISELINIQVRSTPVIFVEFYPVMGIKVQRNEIFGARFLNKIPHKPCTRNLILYNTFQ